MIDRFLIFHRKIIYMYWDFIKIAIFASNLNEIGNRFQMEWPFNLE